MFDVEALRPDGFPLSRAALGLPEMPSHGSTLSDALVRIDYAIKWNKADLDVELADILAAAVRDPDLLDGIDLKPSCERYTRQLLHQGIDYSVLAIVWMPGQMSPVHCHRTWCVLAVQSGWLTETIFTRGADTVEAIGERKLFRGDASHSQSNMAEAHRMANTSDGPAVSIHIYGATFERLGQDVNHVWHE